MLERVAAALAQQQEHRRKQQLLTMLQSVVSELGGGQSAEPPVAAEEGAPAGRRLSPGADKSGHVWLHDMVIDEDDTGTDTTDD